MRKNSRHVRLSTTRKHSHTMVKRTNARLVHLLKNALLVGCFLVAIGLLTFFTISSASAQSVPRLSAAKQQLAQSQAAWHASVDKKRSPI